MTSSSSPAVLVPREPTEAMIEEGFAEIGAQGIVSPDLDLTQVYRAMIAASHSSLQPSASVPAPADGQVASQLQDQIDRLKLAICGGEDVPGAINAVSVEDCERFIREERMNAYHPTDQSSDVSGLVEIVRGFLDASSHQPGCSDWRPDVHMRRHCDCGRDEAYDALEALAQAQQVKP